RADQPQRRRQRDEHKYQGHGDPPAGHGVSAAHRSNRHHRRPDLLMQLTARIRERLRSEDGFSMIVVMTVVLVTLMLTGTAVTASGTDMRFTRRDMDGKRALAAAHTGIAFFQGKLDADPNYWVNCAQPADHLFDRWDGTGTDPRTW